MSILNTEWARLYHFAKDILQHIIAGKYSLLTYLN